MHEIEMLKELAKKFYEMSMKEFDVSQTYSVGDFMRNEHYAKSNAYAVALDEVNQMMTRVIRENMEAITNAYN
jgi:hypothetical protein